MSYTIEQISTLVVDGVSLVPLRQVHTGRTLHKTQLIHLEAGAVGVRLPISIPLPANAAPSYSLIALATTAPIKARLTTSTQYERAEDVEPDGYLLLGNEDVFLTNTTTQHTLYSADGTSESVDAGAYRPQSWVHLSGTEVFTSIMGGTVLINGTTMPAALLGVTTEDDQNISICAANSSTTSGLGVYTFGTAEGDYANLGSEGDGRIFAFWFNSAAKAATLTAAKIRFCSDPYASLITDAAALSGSTIDDPASAASATWITGPTDTNYFEYDFLAQVNTATANRWSYIVCPKDGSHPQGSGFTKTGNPLWSRITKVELILPFSGGLATGVFGRLAGLYFGTPASGNIKSIGMFSRFLDTRTVALGLEFDAPTDQSADVLVEVILS